MPFPVDNIRRLCALDGITLAELERELGIGNGVIARWEKKKTSPPYDRLKQIADRFGATVEQISEPTTKIHVQYEKKKIPDPVKVEDEEFIRLYQAAPQWLKDQVRALLAAAAAGDGAPDVDSTEP